MALKPVCKICLGRWRTGPASVFAAIEITPDDIELRIGYHRKSDDSVSSSVWLGADGRMNFVRELTHSDDILSAWVRCSRDEAHYFVDPAAG